MIHRRTLLKNAFFFAGGIVFLPACGGNDKKTAGAWKALSLTAEEEALVGDMTEILIPATDTPGARALEIDRFVLMMIDDCYTKEEQDSFVKGLRQSQQVAEKMCHRSFERCSTGERINILRALPAHSAETAVFYKLLRELSREGYLKSRYVMTTLQPYELIPGRYNGFFPLKKQHA